MNPTEPDSVSFLRVIIAFGIVCGLMGLLGYGLRYLSMRGIQWPGTKTAATKRLQLVESLPIDARRRLVIVRCDGKEHLILFGIGNDTVVQSDLSSSQKA